MGDYERKTPPPEDPEVAAREQERKERAARQAEALERARLAKAQSFARSSEGKALMAEAFDRVRGRPLKDEDGAHRAQRAV